MKPLLILRGHILKKILRFFSLIAPEKRTIEVQAIFPGAFIVRESDLLRL